MISEQDKQAILDGAYGITRNGKKVKILHFSEKNAPHQKYLFLIFYKNSEEVVWLFDDFTFNQSIGHSHDIVGLWVDEPEPFNLEKALTGEPVKTRDGCMAYVQAMINQPEELSHYTLIGYGLNGIHKEFLSWDINGKAIKADISCDDIIGMWRDSQPEPKTVTLTLPCPVLQPEINKTYYTPVITDVDGYDPDGKFADITEWVVDDDDGNIDWQSQHRLDEGLLFETKQDAQAWLDAMRNSRR